MRFVPASVIVLATASGCHGNVVVPPSADGGTCPDACCVTDADCAAGLFCDVATGQCRALVDCVNSAECAQGQICDMATSLCVAAPPEMSCHQCACVDPLSMGGCAEVCKSNGLAAPNFCDGVPALPTCAKCLMNHCGTIANPPILTDPAACT
jgi:hypothetical protein